MKTELAELESKQVSLAEKVKSVVIVSTETLQNAVNLTADIKEAKKRVKETEKFFKAPLQKQVKEITAKFKPYIESLEKAEADTKKKIVFYQEEQEKIRLAEEDRLRKIQQEKYAKEIAKAEKKGLDIPPPPPPVKIEVEKVEGLSMRKMWDFEIIDATKIPTEYLCIDEKKIRKVVQAGIRTIPGTRIFEKTISAIGSMNQADDDEL